MRSKWVLTLCVMLIVGAFAPNVFRQEQGASADSYQLLVSSSSTRANPVALSGQDESGEIYVFTSPDTADITSVEFFLYDPNGARMSRQVENGAPYDFRGGSATVAIAFDTTTIVDGSYTIKAVVKRTTGTNTTQATFTVANNADSSTPTPAPSTPTPAPSTPTPVPPTPTPEPPVEDDPVANDNQVAIVHSYAITKGTYDWFRYQPRQFGNGAKLNSENEAITNADKYAGWDMLEIPTSSLTPRRYALDEWLTVKLNRSSQVAIVWMDKDTPPAWLRAWPKVGTVTVAGTSRAVYQRSVDAESFTLGGVWGASEAGPSGLGPRHRKPYVVLTAEADGKPSPTPSVPAGQSLPVVGETCPTWVHDQYRAQGPDGHDYATWHAQIDPVYWCHFHHDHGTNPAEFGDGSYTPLFGYAGQNYEMEGMPGHTMTENHHGFKVLVGNTGKTEFLWTFHMGSQTLARYCARYHETNLAIWNGNEVVAELYTVADFGVAKINRTGKAFRPTACPEQADIDTGAGPGQTVGQRMLSIGNMGTPVIHYEDWRADIVHSYKVLGIVGESVEFWQNDAIAYCSDEVCSKTLYEPRNGDANHRVQDMKFSVIDPGHSANGVFYTDARGDRLMVENDSLAVRQYIKPGYTIHFDYSTIKKCIDLDGWGQQPTCGQGQVTDGTEEREASLGPEFYPGVAYLK